MHFAKASCPTGFLNRAINSACGCCCPSLIPLASRRVRLGAVRGVLKRFTRRLTVPSCTHSHIQFYFAPDTFIPMPHRVFLCRNLYTLPSSHTRTQNLENTSSSAFTPCYMRSYSAAGGVRHSVIPQCSHQGRRVSPARKLPSRRPSSSRSRRTTSIGACFRPPSRTLGEPQNRCAA